MAFTSAAFRRNRATAMVMELQASLADAQKLDRGGDTHVKCAIRYALAGCDWLSRNVPGATRLLTLSGGTLDELRAYVAVDALRDRKVAQALAEAKALAGLLDGVDEPAPARTAVPA